MTARHHVSGGERATFSYLSMMTGSDGVSFLLPQLFLSQQRLQGGGRSRGEMGEGDKGESKISYSSRERKSDECKGKRKRSKRA